MMAYWRGQDDEEQKHGGEPLRTGAPRGVASVLQSQLPTQQKQGSGFTNLQNWLDAGKGREQQIIQKTTDIGDTESKEIDKGTKTVTDSTFKALESPGDQKVSDDIMAGDTTFAEKALSQEHTGPRTLGYDPSSRQGLQQLGGLQSAKGSASVLGRQGASTGMRNLDTALFGADPLSRAASEGAKTKLGDLGFATDDKQGTMSSTGKGLFQGARDTVSKHVGQQDAEADQQRALWRGRFEGIGNDILWKVGSRAGERNARDLSTFSADMYPHLTTTIDSGTLSSIGNTATDKELTGLKTLRGLLGLDRFGVVKSDYRAPTMTLSPGKQPATPTAYAWPTQQLADIASGMSPAEKRDMWNSMTPEAKSSGKFYERVQQSPGIPESSLAPYVTAKNKQANDDFALYDKLRGVFEQYLPGILPSTPPPSQLTTSDAASILNPKPQEQQPLKREPRYPWPANMREWATLVTPEEEDAAWARFTGGGG